jgi:septal ring factor EnvC (AmiA/AmiB activator)
MVKIIFIALTFVFFSNFVAAQAPTREELERQRQQLKNEIEQTEKMLNENKTKTKGTYNEWKGISNKVNLQERVIDNINRDIDLLDNNIYSIQKDIHKYDRLLDTLKQEYAKSMVYAYKNRSNYEFLNFIFSAASFNDAIKRIAYLKSYRTYREMQGENILRTQELRRQRIEALGGVKEKKNIVLDNKSKEMDVLEKQKEDKDRVLAELKKQGKQLNTQYAAKKKQLSKVSNAIAAAIKKATDEAKKAAIAKAAEDERNRVANNVKTNTNPSSTNIKSITTNTRRTEPKKQEDFPLNAENTILNEKFENNRGALPWPVQHGYILMNFGPNKLPSGKTEIDNPGLSIGTDIGAPVKAVFNGTVSNVINVEEMQVVMIQHGRYFTSYSNLSGVTVQKGQTVTSGQVIGKAMSNDDGIGEIDFIMSNDKNNFDPERWLKPR